LPGRGSRLFLILVVLRTFLIFLVQVRVLRRAFADARGDLRIVAGRGLIFDGDDVDLMPPVVAEVEPVLWGRR
jgi:hypothetical protein